MNRNKTFAITSIVIGLIGIIIGIYFDSKMSQMNEDFGALSELVTLFKYGDTNRILLMTLSLLGIVLGIIPIIKKKIWWSILGAILCAFNFLEAFISG